ncbi:MAG: alpha-amylase family protein [Candidatus Acidiferrales bacterium]
METRGQWSGALLLFVMCSLPAAASAQAQPQPSGVEVVSNSGWPELRVDGKPFFIHAASFDYFRVPRDLWPHCLDRYRELGINTIDLRIPWNWHEPAAGKFDFTGETNPRRDLRGLLHLIADRRFKLIIRAGPAIGDQWRSGGFPDWLLADPLFAMTPLQIADGDEPPLEREFQQNAGAAAAVWLAHAGYQGEVRNWLAALGAELAPFDSHRTYIVALSAETASENKNESKDQPKEESSSGPLLFIVLEDKPSLLADRDSANLEHYLDSLREALLASGIVAPVLIEPADLAVTGASPLGAWLSNSTPEHVKGVSGSWSPFPEPQPNGEPRGEQFYERRDAESTMLLLGALAEQAGVPPVVTDFQLSSADSGEDDPDVKPPPSTVLLGSRMLLARGARGIEYSPLQDSITPAGYETSSSNRYVHRNSPLDVEGESRPGALEVERNGEFVAEWGEWLAGAHFRSDFGILDLRAEVSAPEWKTGRERASKILEQLIRVTELAGRTPELLDPTSQSVDRLLRDPVLLSVVPDPDDKTFALTKSEQETLIEYVRRGGTLIFAPRLPSGGEIAELWSSPGTPLGGPGGPQVLRHAYGQGAAIEWSQDFFSGVSVEDSFENQSLQGAAAQAAQDLASVLEDAGAIPTARPLDKKAPPSPLLVSELVADNNGTEGSATLDRCSARPLCAAALISLTNLDPTEPQDADLEVLAAPLFPETEVGGSLELHATVPAHDSLLLPLRASLCTTATTIQRCRDELVYAGAELLGVVRDGNSLNLTFYAPVRATVLLRLESEPEKIELDENQIEGSWAPGMRLLTVTLMRGAAPDYLRVLKIHLHYKPHVPEQPNPPKQRRANYEASIVNAVRLPLGGHASIRTSPPLVLLQNEREDRVVLRTTNRGDSAQMLTARVDGPVRGSDIVRVGAGEIDLTRIKLEPAGPPGSTGTTTTESGLAQGELTLQGGGERVAIPIAFADLREGGPLHYQYDFDRDGAPEWTLETNVLRLILCPRDGGRAIALVSKLTGENLTTVAGALRDWFLPAGATQPEDFTFNRPYEAEWTSDRDQPGLRMKYHAAEAGAAGATIEKIITLISPDTFEVQYRVALAPAEGSQGTAGMQFVAASWVPATAADQDGTKLCWSDPVAPQPAQSANPPSPTCVPFHSGDSPRKLPPGAARIEIGAPGSSGVRVEWTAGEMNLQMDRGAVLLKLVLPLDASAPAQAVMRYTVLSVP